MILAVNTKSTFASAYQKHFPDLVARLTNFQELVPLLHIHSHIEDCQFRYNLAYHQGAVQTHSENLEVWGAQNSIGGMTKEMNNGHWHNILNDYNSNWNWLKVQQMCEFVLSVICSFLNFLFSARSLYHGLKNSRQLAVTAHVEYLVISKVFGRERVLQWSRQSCMLQLRNGEWTSIYHHPKSKGMSFFLYDTYISNSCWLVPDQASVFQNLLAEELKTRHATLGPMTPNVTFINMGIHIQQDQ